jgi:hypothetical protein
MSDLRYALIILAALLMHVLEIVRVALADRGIGLLPFNLVGLLVVLALSNGRRCDSVPMCHVVLAGYWDWTDRCPCISEAGRMGG